MTWRNCMKTLTRGLACVSAVRPRSWGSRGFLKRCMETVCYGSVTTLITVSIFEIWPRRLFGGNDIK